MLLRFRLGFVLGWVLLEGCFERVWRFWVGIGFEMGGVFYGLL